MASLTLAAGTHTFTSITIGNGDDITLDATSGGVDLHFDSMANNVANTGAGTGILFTNNTFNRCTLAKNNTGSLITWAGPQPRFDTVSGVVFLVTPHRPGKASSSPMRRPSTSLLAWVAPST